MLVVAIDPSLTSSGICVVRDGVVELAKTTTNHPDLPTIDRVAEIRREIMDVIENLNDPIKEMWQPPDAIVIEGFSFGSRGRGLDQTFYLGWRIREDLEDLRKSNDIPWFEFTPTHVKKYATGKGNANKDVIMQQVYKKWGFEAKDNNTADAFVLAMMGADKLKEGSKWGLN